MKFRRNVKEEKVFNKVAIFSLITEVVLVVIYFITFDEVLLRFIFLLLLIFPLYFYIVHLLKKSFVEFYEDKIVLINGNGMDIVINIKEVQTILIPSSKALNNKRQENPIVIKRATIINIITYNLEIENYIKNNYSIPIDFYDKYTQAIK